MEKNNQILTEEKIKSKFKKINELIVIAIGFLIIAFMLMLFNVNTFINNKDSIEFENKMWDEYQVRDFMDIFQEEHLKTYSVLKYVLTSCSFACMIGTFWVIGEICREIKNTGKPFSKNIVKNMNVLTRIIIIWAIISLFTTIFEINIGIGFVPACIICVLKYIFEYGYKLQIESDETL